MLGNSLRHACLLQEEYRNSMPASSFQQQKLRVCEVCSAYLGLHDNDRRLADHFGGKLHIGFIKIREKLKDLKVLETYFSFLYSPLQNMKGEKVSMYICLPIFHPSQNLVAEKREKREVERAKRREDREKEKEKDSRCVFLSLANSS